jgi:hypothetical protein
MLPDPFNDFAIKEKERLSLPYRPHRHMAFFVAGIRYIGYLHNYVFSHDLLVICSINVRAAGKELGVTVCRGIIDKFRFKGFA